jgi:uncharacterized protein
MGRIGWMILTVGCLALWSSCLAGPEPATSVSPAEAQAAQLVNLLVKNDFDGAARGFDEKMKAALPPAQLGEVWKSMLSQVGEFRGQLGTHAEKAGGYEVVVVSCRFAKAVIDVKVSLDGNRQIAGLFFTPGQEPATEPASRPAYFGSGKYHELDLKIGTGETALPATVTIPEGIASFPVVVLVHGSGPNDRDETIGPNKPFRDLACGLAAKGIAVLRYEKRSKAFPLAVAAAMETLTVKEETMDDALDAVKAARTVQGADPKRIYVLGHSLGGFLGPRIVKQDGQIAGLIIMAGNTRPLEDVILDQVTYILSLEETDSDAQKAQLDTLKLQVRKAKDPKLNVARFSAAQLPLGIPKAYWLDLRGYNPVETAQGLSQPILILQGGRDYQVTGRDYDGWVKALTAKPSVTLKLYPKLNHLFMEGQGQITPEEYQRAGYVSKDVIDDIARWVKQRAAAASAPSVARSRVGG